jgi:hypothetical protein
MRPLVLERSFKDGRVFRNLAALPRFWATWDFAPLARGEFPPDESIDFRTKSFVAEPVPLELSDMPRVPADKRSVKIDVSERSDGGYELVTRSEVPFLLNSSEKLTPELRVLLDGKRLRVISMNSMFAGALVPAGEHRIVFEREIGRGWWLLASCAALLVVLAAWQERRRPAIERSR